MSEDLRKGNTAAITKSASASDTVVPTTTLSTTTRGFDQVDFKPAVVVAEVALALVSKDIVRSWNKPDTGHDADWDASNAPKDGVPETV